ncbi:hypothetical protein F5X71_19075 [Nocardia brasiliensis]|uniref:Uncharacterized protein n=1 Tax=Nocardia brasiliensis TaxID=37326 RepID=A0A6G9XTJ7_NOCBR|nr:hypothetical protein [Nocardia brasiliensis]QIS04153.1 hypothetical protein F5X71_19075 [Nocardia brasiliensis]
MLLASAIQFVPDEGRAMRELLLIWWWCRQRRHRHARDLGPSSRLRLLRPILGAAAALALVLVGGGVIVFGPGSEPVKARMCLPVVIHPPSTAAHDGVVPCR